MDKRPILVAVGVFLAMLLLVIVFVLPVACRAAFTNPSMLC